MNDNVVKRLRRRANLSQKDLAEKANLTSAYISLIESGKKTPSFNAMKSIADALGVPAEVIYILSMDSDNIKDDEGRLKVNNIKNIVENIYAVNDKEDGLPDGLLAS